MESKMRRRFNFLEWILGLFSYFSRGYNTKHNISSSIKREGSDLEGILSTSDGTNENLAGNTVYPTLLDVLLEPVKGNPRLRAKRRIQDDYLNFRGLDELYVTLISEAPGMKTLPSWVIWPVIAKNNEVRMVPEKKWEKAKEGEFYDFGVEGDGDFRIYQKFDGRKIAYRFTKKPRDSTIFAEEQQKEVAMILEEELDLISQPKRRRLEEKVAQEAIAPVTAASSYRSEASEKQPLYQRISDWTRSKIINFKDSRRQSKLATQCAREEARDTRQAQREARPEIEAEPRRPFYEPFGNFISKYRKALVVTTGLGLMTALAFGGYFLAQTTDFNQKPKNKIVEEVRKPSKLPISGNGGKITESPQSQHSTSSQEIPYQPKPSAEQQVPKPEKSLQQVPTPLTPKIQVPQQPSQPSQQKQEKPTLEEVTRRVERGDILWNIAKSLQVTNIPGFINDLVAYQSNNSNTKEFLQRIGRDTIYVQNGKVHYAENVDGIKGDLLNVGDIIVIPKELVTQYGGNFKRATQLENIVRESAGISEESKSMTSATKGPKQKYEREQNRQYERKTERRESRTTPRATQRTNKKEKFTFTSTSAVPYIERVVGLALPYEEKPFGVWEPSVVDNREEFYERITGKDIKRVPYSTPFSLSLPKAIAESEKNQSSLSHKDRSRLENTSIKSAGTYSLRGSQITSRYDVVDPTAASALLSNEVGIKYIGARLAGNANINLTETTELIQKMPSYERMQLAQGFYDTKNKLLRNNQEGNSISKIAKTSDYAWLQNRKDVREFLS